MTSRQVVLIVRDRDPEWEQVALCVHEVGQLFLAYEFTSKHEGLIRDLVERDACLAVAVVLDDSNAGPPVRRPSQSLDRRDSQDVMFMLGFVRALVPSDRIVIVTRDGVALAPELDEFATVYLNRLDWKESLQRRLLDAGVGFLSA